MRLRLLILAATVGACLAVGAGPAAPAQVNWTQGNWNGECAATSVKFTTSGPGTVTLGPGMPLHGRTMHVNGLEAYLAKNVTVTFRMQDTTFVISPGTYFRPECFGAYGKGPYPSVKLYRGRVRVKSGAARRLMVHGSTGGSPQQTGVRTWEAVVHTLAPHTFEYTVERKAETPADGNAGKGRVTVETVKGGPIMLSPRAGLKKKWACKTGETFTVDWQGNVTQR